MATVVRRLLVEQGRCPCHPLVGDEQVDEAAGNGACEYDAYVPDSIAGRQLSLSADTASEIEAAEDAIVHLNEEVDRLPDAQDLVRSLLIAESAASYGASLSLFGVDLTIMRVHQAQMARSRGEEIEPSGTVFSTLNNVDALVHGFEQVSYGGLITSALILEIHRRLFAGTEGQEEGKFRDRQNWLLGPSPCKARYVPPPFEMVPDLVEDLVAFANDDSISPVAQAAIAYAQFESIHPFMDGNGRVGKSLIHLIFRRSGLSPRVIVPISFVLVAGSHDYYKALDDFHYMGPPDSEVVTEHFNRLITLFARACVKAADKAQALEKSNFLDSSWRQSAQVKNLMDASNSSVVIPNVRLNAEHLKRMQMDKLDFQRALEDDLGQIFSSDDL